MQPLYFFNVKSNKESDSLSSLEDKRLVVKEASTPCFIGSPVNALKPNISNEVTSIPLKKNGSSY
jgi:hypothetical protein